MRILCKIFGCKLDQYGPACIRCNTWLYDWGFVHREMAWLNPWYNFIWRLRCNRDWFFHRCAVCKKPMVFTKKECCSEECYDQWLPF
jgi:hypothetical protein